MDERPDSSQQLMDILLVMDEKGTLQAVSGVKDVASFDDNTVIALTDLGELTVRGENLRVDCLSVETGELEISGTINGVMYTDDKKVQSGFFARFLK